MWWSFSSSLTFNTFKLYNVNRNCGNFSNIKREHTTSMNIRNMFRAKWWTLPNSGLHLSPMNIFLSLTITCESCLNNAKKGPKHTKESRSWCGPHYLFPHSPMQMLLRLLGDNHWRWQWALATTRQVMDVILINMAYQSYCCTIGYI